MKDMKEHW